MKKYMIISMVSFGIIALIGARKFEYPRVFRSAFQPSWDDRLDVDAIEHCLQHEQIADTQNISRYLSKTGTSSKASHEMLFVTLESGLKGVFKSGEYHYAEVAAYRACKALGQRLVPPTVIRTINGKQGSLQFLVESPIDVKKGPHGAELFKKVSSKNISDMMLFYFVFGQWDNHRGNQIINVHQGKGYLALIDNSAILHRSYAHYGDYSFIEKGVNKKVYSSCTRSFPFDKAKTIRPQSLNQLKSVFKPYISDAAINKLWMKRKPITYCIWCDTLWIKMQGSVKPSSTKEYYASSLKAYERLHRATLEKIWAEWLLQDREHAQQLIELTLKRRDAMLKAAYSSGTILAA